MINLYIIYAIYLFYINNYRGKERWMINLYIIYAIYLFYINIYRGKERWISNLYIIYAIYLFKVMGCLPLSPLEQLDWFGQIFFVSSKLFKKNFDSGIFAVCVWLIILMSNLQNPSFVSTEYFKYYISHQFHSFYLSF